MPLDVRSCPPLIVLAGPTAGGKTALSLDLAEALRASGRVAEIISADSRQVYRGMDIGTAKVTPAEQARVPHHCLDLVDPDAAFTVSDFATAAGASLAHIESRGGVAILAGGTGFYLRAIARGLATEQLPWDPTVRAEVERMLAEQGPQPLIDDLRRLAPTRAAALDLRNPRRLVRALEIARLAGDAPLPQPSPYPRDVLWLGLGVEVVTLRQRIFARARAQFAAGLIEETRQLVTRFDPSLPSFTSIGYAESLAHIAGTTTLEEAILANAHRNTAFARRQRTWFRSEPEIQWLDATTHLPIAAAIEMANRYLA
jgi:tRNA dimethylallyltransferase